MTPVANGPSEPIGNTEREDRIPLEVFQFPRQLRVLRFQIGLEIRNYAPRPDDGITAVGDFEGTTISGSGA